MSFDTLVTLLAGLGPVGDVGSIDLVRHGSFDRHARNNVKSNVNKLVMENEPLVCQIPICLKTRSKSV